MTVKKLQKKAKLRNAEYFGLFLTNCMQRVSRGNGFAI